MTLATADIRATLRDESAEGRAMRKIIRFLTNSDERCLERHYCHRYVRAIENLVDEGLFNSALPPEREQPEQRTIRPNMRVMPRSTAKLELA